MFATDRDLLALEPNLFRDVGWVGQRLVKATGAISGTTLTISAQDVGFDAAGVTAGTASRPPPTSRARPPSGAR